jgi:hypothetical protein
MQKIQVMTRLTRSGRRYDSSGSDTKKYSTSQSERTSPVAARPLAYKRDANRHLSVFAVSDWGVGTPCFVSNRKANSIYLCISRLPKVHHPLNRAKFSPQLTMIKGF